MLAQYSEDGQIQKIIKAKKAIGLGESKVFLDKNGTITKGALTRRFYTNLNSRFLKEGQNILAFKIIGDPTDIETGFYLWWASANSIPLC